MATRTVEPIKDPREEKMSTVAVGTRKDIVSAVDELVDSPDPQHKDGLLARIGKRIVNFYDWLSGPPMSEHDQIEFDDRWDRYYRYNYPFF